MTSAPHKDLSLSLGNLVGQFKLHDDHIHQSGDRWAAGFNDKVRSFPIKWISKRVKVTQPSQWVGDLK